MEIIANLLWQMRAHFHKSLKKRKKIICIWNINFKRDEIDSMIDVYYSIIHITALANNFSTAK